MANNKLGEAASFELPSLVGLLTADSSSTPGDTSGRSQHSVMFPMLQVLRLRDNSIRSLQGLQLFGFTGQLPPGLQWPVSVALAAYRQQLH